MFNCKYRITRNTNRCLTVSTVLHATQTEPLLFSKQRNVSSKSEQYVICLKQCFLFLCYKKTTVCLKVLVKFHETYLIPNQLHLTPSAKIYLEVKGFRSEKGTRPAVGSVLRASFAALSAASFPRISVT